MSLCQRVCVCLPRAHCALPVRAAALAWFSRIGAVHQVHSDYIGPAAQWSGHVGRSATVLGAQKTIIEVEGPCYRSQSIVTDQHRHVAIRWTLHDLQVSKIHL